MLVGIALCVRCGWQTGPMQNFRTKNVIVAATQWAGEFTAAAVEAALPADWVLADGEISGPDNIRIAPADGDWVLVDGVDHVAVLTDRQFNNLFEAVS